METNSSLSKKKIIKQTPNKTQKYISEMVMKSRDKKYVGYHAHLETNTHSYLFPSPYHLAVAPAFWTLDGEVYGQKVLPQLDFNQMKLIYLHLHSHQVVTTNIKARKLSAKNAMMVFLRSYLPYLVVTKHFPSKETKINYKYLNNRRNEESKHFIGKDSFDKLNNMMGELGADIDNTNSGSEKNLDHILSNYADCWLKGSLWGPGTEHEELQPGYKYFYYLEFLHKNGLFPWVMSDKVKGFDFEAINENQIAYI